MANSSTATVLSFPGIIFFCLLSQRHESCLWPSIWPLSAWYCLLSDSLLHFQEHTFLLTVSQVLTFSWVLLDFSSLFGGSLWSPMGLIEELVEESFCWTPNVFIQSHLSQWPKHLILGHWWIDFTIFGADLACVFFVFTTPNSVRPILRHFWLVLLATENASLICTARVLGAECKLQLIKALEVECY